MRFVVQFYDPKQTATVTETKVVNHEELLTLIDENRNEDAKDRRLFTVYELGEELLDWS